MQILGIDPGLDVTGWALVEGREILAAGSIKTDAKLSDYDRSEQVWRAVRDLCRTHMGPVAVEGWAYHGSTHGKAATCLPVVLGGIMAMVLAEECQLVTLRRVDVLRRWGLGGTCDKARARRALEAVLTHHERARNEHARDAAMVAYAAGMRGAISLAGGVLAR